MRRVAAVFLFFPVLVAGLSCTQDTFVDLRGPVVPARVDLVAGFANQEIRIYINDQVCYTAAFNSSEPLNWPVAQFQTVVSRGTNTIAVECRPSSSGSEFTRRVADVTVGDSDRYYLGLILQSSTLSINIQSTPFYYL
jgi:hypothetical protein